jgi:hypothetical protein
MDLEKFGGGRKTTKKLSVALGLLKSTNTMSCAPQN